MDPAGAGGGGVLVSIRGGQVHACGGAGAVLNDVKGVVRSGSLVEAAIVPVSARAGCADGGHVDGEPVAACRGVDLDRRAAEKLQFFRDHLFDDTIPIGFAGRAVYPGI